MEVVEPFDEFKDGLGKPNTGVPALATQQFNMPAVPERFNACTIDCDTKGDPRWHELFLRGVPGDGPGHEFTFNAMIPMYNSPGLQFSTRGCL